jgi:hypothetical protein
MCVLVGVGGTGMKIVRDIVESVTRNVLLGAQGTHKPAMNLLELCQKHLNNLQLSNFDFFNSYPFLMS